MKRWIEVRAEIHVTGGGNPNGVTQMEPYVSLRVVGPIPDRREGSEDAIYQCDPEQAGANQYMRRTARRFDKSEGIKYECRNNQDPEHRANSSVNGDLVSGWRTCRCEDTGDEEGGGSSKEGLSYPLPRNCFYTAPAGNR